MYELKKIGKVFTSKSVGTGPSSLEKRIYRAAVSQRLRNTGLAHTLPTNMSCVTGKHVYQSFGCSADPSRSVTGWFLIVEGTAVPLWYIFCLTMSISKYSLLAVQSKLFEFSWGRGFFVSCVCFV